MAVAQALVRLTHDELRVEAGLTVETTVEVESTIEAWREGNQEYSIQVQGLPDGWYTLAESKLRVEAGQRREVLLVIHPPHEDPSVPLGEYPIAIHIQPLPSGEVIKLPARLVALPPGATTMRSRLLDYLPGVYQSDYFLARFLLIFQSLLDPIEQTVDNTHHYLDPFLTPAEFLPWLASWVGLTLDPDMDERHQRELIARAVDLWRWKGTRRALREELRMRIRGRALVVENFDGMRIGQDAALGLNTQLGVRRDQCITVTVAKAGGMTVEHQEADSLVRELKPAHVGHVVRVVPAPSRERGNGHG